MTGYITYRCAREHANDLLREAESFRRAGRPRTPRQIKFSPRRLTTRGSARAATA
jgi:hypothetical protein